MGGKVRQLVCEGHCNRGDVAAFDKAISAAGRCATFAPSLDGGDRHTSAADDRVLMLGRSLVHTPHVETGPDVFKCDHCGKPRRYGRSY